MQAITGGHVRAVELLLKCSEAGVNATDKVIAWRGTGVAQSEEFDFSGVAVQRIAVVGKVACNDAVEFS